MITSTTELCRGPLNRSQLLVHRQDRYSILVVACVLGLQTTLYVVQAGWLLMIPLIIAMRWVHLVEHNQAHLPVFLANRNNNLFEFALIIGTSQPVEGYRIHHVRTHHVLENSPEDWTGPFAYKRASYPDKPVSLWVYVLLMPVRAWLRSFRVAWNERRDDSGRLFFSAMIWLFLISALLAAHDIQAFSKFYLIPWGVLTAGAALANWLHHDGCSFDDPVSSANSRLSILSRQLGFNIGYHAAHHAYPSAHWTELPALHQRMIETAAHGNCA